MEFQQVLQNINNRNARKKGIKAYYNSGQVFFSRLFGYERVGDNYIPIQKYKTAIKEIFAMLITDKSILSIKAKLDSDGFRDSSKNRYSIDRIISLVRPTYAGYIKKGIVYKRIENIEPIVSLSEYKIAKRQLDMKLKRIVNII